MTSNTLASVMSRPRSCASTMRLRAWTYRESSVASAEGLAAADEDGGGVGSAPSAAYQRRNIRSMKIITVVEIVETTNGSDTCRTSRPPQGRVHQS